MVKILSSEITPEHVYMSRRQFMVGVGGLALGAVTTASCGRQATVSDIREDGGAVADPPVAGTDDLGDNWTTYEAITHYNNYYEFSTDKEDVASLSQGLKTTPWSIDIGGLVSNPGSYEIDDLTSRFDQEERVYRLRCVEGWSMVIPWLGFPLHKLLAHVEPTVEARYVRFETLYDPEQLPGQKNRWYTWPYAEGLRLDEAMHDLTILASGIYGKELPPQNGSPLRLVVPWKYGFKSIKSIVKIDLIANQPTTLWMTAAPHEYGFYANVNPNVHHPRWSQATERRIGELQRRPTLMFNGYEEDVADLYHGMDLHRLF